MKYKVLLQRLAVEDLDEATAWAAQRAPTASLRWIERFHATAQTLDSNSQRCPLAREDSKVDIELRELHFGRRPNVFRIIFTVDGSAVRILRIRRAQRRWLTQREIDEANRE